VRVYSLDCNVVVHVLHLCGEHFHLLDGVHALGSGLEAFFTPPLIGDHLLDQCCSFCDGEVEEGSSSSNIDVGS
jgi:hypothetical protein